MLTKRAFMGIGAAVLGVGVGGYFWLSEPEPSHSYFAVDGVALRGADPVAYFTQSDAVIGTPDHAYDWSGVTWHFASQEHLELFKAAPEAYAPQFGGYCAWAVAAKQRLFSIQPQNWAVVDGKLYLNFSDRVEETWNTDRSGFIKKGIEVWPDVRKQLL